MLCFRILNDNGLFSRCVDEAKKMGGGHSHRRLIMSTILEIETLKA